MDRMTLTFSEVLAFREAGLGLEASCLVTLNPLLRPTLSDRMTSEELDLGISFISWVGWF